jgi:hypothetical protein
VTDVSCIGFETNAFVVGVISIQRLLQTPWPRRSPRCRRSRTGTRNCWWLKSLAATPALEKSGQRQPITLGTHPSPGYSIRFAPPGNSETIKLPPAQPSICPLTGSFHTASRGVRHHLVMF